MNQKVKSSFIFQINQNKPLEFSYDELMNLNGEYSKLFNMQAEYYKGGDEDDEKNKK